MFEQTLIEPTPGSKKPMSILASLTVQVWILCILIGAPLLYTQGLPGHVLKSFLVAPPVPHAALPDSAETKRQTTSTAPRLLDIKQLITHTVVLTRPTTATTAPAAPDVGLFGSDGGVSDSAIQGVIGSTPEAAAPPPVSSAPKPNAGPLRVGGRFEEANLTHKVVPTYPAMAVTTRVQGVVQFTAVISKEGNIEKLQLVRGHPLLVAAAREAVLQWKYRPTLMNGVPVEVVTDITVNFSLSQ